MTFPAPVRIDGPCPFLLCLEQGPHEHEVCPDCGAVRFGNITCCTCRNYHGMVILELDGVPTQKPLGFDDLQPFLDRLERLEADNR